MVEVNRDLVPIKLLYVLFYGGLASFIPFKSIYQKQLGMTSAQNGVIQAVMQLSSLFSPPIAGIITDKTKAYKAVLATLLFFAITFTIPFYFVPQVEVEPPLSIASCCAVVSTNNFLCTTNATVLNGTDCVRTKNMTIIAYSALMTNCSEPYVDCYSMDKLSKEVYGFTFALLIILTVLLSFFLAPVAPLVDASAMDTLGMARVNNFGNQRLWGAVGFGIAGLVVSYLTDLISPKEIYGKFEKNYSLALGSAGLLWGLALIVMVVSVDISSPKAKGIIREVGKLLKKIDVVAFLLVVLVSGYSTGVKYSFLFWYLLELKGYRQYILGFTMLVTCLSEIPMFRFSGFICQRLGYVSVLCIGLVAVSIRFFIYTLITEAWQVLLVEGLHGISFALPMAAVCSYAAVIAPKDAVATLISISQTVYWGVGNMLGALLGGLIYNAYGGKTTFLVTCGLCLTTAVLYWLGFGQFGIISRCCPRTKQEKDYEEGEEKKEIVTTPEEEPLHDAVASGEF